MAPRSFALCARVAHWFAAPHRVVHEVLRFRRLWKCYDMKDFAFYRYNMLEEKGHWFPGVYATPEAVAKVDRAKAPEGVDVQALLTETHRQFFREKKKSAG